MNERVLRLREVVVINERGDNLGLVDVHTAFALARTADLDLVVVNATVRPTVAKIMDYGKAQYEQEKRERESSKKSKVTEVKAIRLRPGTDDHDVETKLKNVVRFLREGHKVKMTVMFRSREITRPEMGRQALGRFIAATADIATPDSDPKLEGRSMSLVLTPRPGIKQQAKAEAEKPATAESED